ncbi:MAG TPA: DUF748 domain-containing protein [Verrucomicrobiae bacterium]|nr:DUF748 domain-containing protein [Verrucomicrobiae bacterium]
MGEKSTMGKKPAAFKWLLGLGIVVLIYTVTGFFIVPAIIKSQMLKRLPALTKRQVSVAEVKCNPYVLSLTIRGLALTETNGDVFSSFDEFYGNFQLLASLAKRSWVFDEVTLTRPFAQVTYQADGNFNFANLLTDLPAKPKTASSAPPSLPSIQIDVLSITNGSVAITDLKRETPFHTKFLPIDFFVTNLTTIRDKNSPYSFVARAGTGETFAWSGTITINPLRSSGIFRLGALALPQFGTYARDYAKFQIANGLLDIAADYNYDSSTNMLDLNVSKAAVFLTHLELKAPDTGETVVNIPELSVTDADASVLHRSAHVGKVKSSDGSLLVRQNQDGTINLLSLLNLPTNAPATEPKAASTGTPPLTAKIDEIIFTNYSIKAEDKKLEKPASFDIDQLTFDLKGVSNASNAPVTASASLLFQKTGMINVDGTATLLPPSADLQVAITNLDLRAIQPYVEQQIKLAITSGTVDVNGHAKYASPEPGAPMVTFTGDVTVAKFDTADDVLFKDFAKWDSLNVTGIHFQMQPIKVEVDRVKFSGLNTSVIVGPDRRLNLETVLRNQISTAKANAAPKEKLDLKLGALELENASLHFADDSIEPHCSFDVQQFDGTITGLSSQENTTATVDFKGKIDSHSPFGVSGKINPLVNDIYADISVAITNTELTAFTPYTEKFAGRPLSKGKLSFAVHYLIDKKALKSENGFYVDQLTLGAKNNSPNATTLPVKLAVALLKDRHGRIQLDVPVSGRLDDPKFKLGPIIWQVVENLIAKAATSPFSLLGAVFGGGEEMSYVNFAPGQAAIPDTETNKLNTLSKALYERPELTVEINGSADPDQDRAPLAQMKLQQQIKSLWVKELTDAGKPAVSVDEVKLDPKDYERLLLVDYKTTIGNYKPSEVGTNTAVVSTNSPLAKSKAPSELYVSPEVRALLAGQSSDTQRGAALLLRPGKPEKISTPKPMLASNISKASASNPTSTTTTESTAAATDAEPQLADMEAQLLQKITVTDDDLRDLMKQRAAAVQTYMLKSGKVTGDRLFITAPKPVTLSLKGEDRVILSLD